MKSYIGAKIIQATEMDLYTFNSSKGIESDTDNKPGYLVAYPDGYSSWSPKNVFEEAYREISVAEAALV